jgi:hypothetical protein
MNDVIARKWSSCKPNLVAATMFLKLNMSLFPNNRADVAASPIWNILIPFVLELSNDIDDSNDKEEEEEEEEETP